MTEKLDGNQGDLFPKLLQDESLRVERHVAEKKLRDRRALPDRINGYWHGFYQRKLVAWTLDAELKKQYSFDYRFCPDGELTLLFYYPTLSEIGLSESEYLAFERGLIELLDPSTVSDKPSVDFTVFLRWTLDCYEDSDYFPESKLERIQELISDDGEIDDESNEFNILKTNSWEIDVDRSISKPAVRLKAQLNTVSKVFVIDHFDSGVEEELFDLDDFKWWSRADGEGIWACYESLFGSKKPNKKESFWGRLSKWIGE